MKILTVFGTRPEAIKMAPLIKAFQNNSAFEIKVCVTAQHRSMLDQVLKLFNITPHYDLDIMGINQSLSQITQLTMQRLENILDEFRADWVIVQGDTNTTFAASLSAFYKKIPVAHIEAGLRTGNIYSPWPEEINRQLTSRIAQLHFAPTLQAEKNLLQEGIEKNNIIISGNTVVDALLETVAILKQEFSTVEHPFKTLPPINEKKKLILVTSHRRENFGYGLEQICLAIKKLAEREDVQIIYPVHLNPNIQDTVKKLLADKKNIYLTPPQDYLPFVYLMMKSYLIFNRFGWHSRRSTHFRKTSVSRKRYYRKN